MTAGAPAHPGWVLVADDAPLVRAGISHVLTAAGFRVSEAATADEAVAAAEVDDPPAAMVLDIRMPPTHTDEGIRALERIRRAGHRIGVLLLSMYANPVFAVRVLDAGPGTGYLLKERVADVDTLAAAVRRVAAGGTVVDPQVVAELAGPRPRSRNPIHRLTGRERQVLSLMAEGCSNAGIAAGLNVGVKTIETHIGRILTKLDIVESADHHRRVQAVLRWMGRGDG